MFSCDKVWVNSRDRINALFKVLLSRLLILWICETLESSSQRKINVNTMHFSASTKIGSNLSNSSLRKQPTFQDATTGFPSKWRSRNELRNSILMMRHYLDLFGWKFASANQQHYSHLGSNASSVWKICARFWDVISWGKKVVASPNSTVFSGYWNSSQNSAP